MRNILHEIFDARSIKLNLDGKTKEMVLAELVNVITDLHPDCNPAEMLEAIRKREEKMSTGIGNGFAIPHGFYRGIENMAGAIGVSKEGIDFGALDKKPVFLIFLLVVNEHAPENHMRALTQIYKLARSEAFPLIKNADNARDIETILSQIHRI